MKAVALVTLRSRESGMGGRETSSALLPFGAGAAVLLKEDNDDRRCGVEKDGRRR